MKHSSLIIGIALALFMLLEFLFPLRLRRENAIKRFATNLVTSIVALPFTRLLIYPVVIFLGSFVAQSHWGLLNILRLNEFMHFIVGFVLLDYLIYWWHVANHKVRFFWRFHQVHHADKDMDASTALRFHFGELFLSGLVRICLILILGFHLETLFAFDLSVTVIALFHHSNLKLPLWLEKNLNKIIVTPLFHQNHHSYFQHETDSNYSTIFSFWDRLHRSHTKMLASEKVTIGLPFFHEEKFNFLQLMTLPFIKLKAWPKEFIQRK